MQTLGKLFGLSLSKKKARSSLGRQLVRRVIVEELESRRVLAAAPFSEDFEAFTGDGFDSAPVAGQLDSDDWRVVGLSDGAGTFGGSHTTGDFARGASTGGVSGGGIYAFDTGGGNDILGLQPGGSDMTPGTITLKIDNTSGGSIANWDIAYDIWSLNDQERGNTLNFQFSTDDSTYTPVGSLDFTSPEASDASGWVTEPRSATIAATVADGGSLYVQWITDDSLGGGSRDELGIDNVSIQAASGTSLSISPISADKPEGNGGTTPFTFEITRSGDTSGSTDVTWTKVDVDTDASDFSGTLTDTVTFAPTETTKTVTIDVVGDLVGESNEDFTIDLSAPTGGALISVGSATGTIQDDDSVLSSAVINEFVVDHSGTDVDEFIEIFGAPSEDLSTYDVIVIESEGAGIGTVDAHFDLGISDASGFQLAGGAVLAGGTFENGSSSILLVRGFTGMVGDDLDVDDDGTFDTTPWSDIIDDLARIEDSGDVPYSTTILDAAAFNDGVPDVPGGASRIPSGTDTDSAADWIRNDPAGDGLPSFGSTGTTSAGEALNTPGAANSHIAASPMFILTQSQFKTDVNEDGMTDTVLIGLSSNPLAPVDVVLTPNGQLDLGNGPGTAITLTFNDRLTQTVTVGAVDDGTVEAAIHSGSISILSTSGDFSYDGFTSSITANIGDNDVTAPPAYINEFVVNHSGPDLDEYVEVISTASANLGALTVLLLDVDGDGVGAVENAELVGSADGSGFASVFTLPPDTFFDSNAAIMLVEGFSGSVGLDLDVDDNGIFDFDESPVPSGGLTAAPWTAVRDGLAAIDAGEPTFGLVELSAATLNDGNGFSPGGASRIPDATAATTASSEWVRNDFGGEGLPGGPYSSPPAAGTALNTPDALNSLISGLVVVETYGNTSVEEGGAGDSILLTLVGNTPTADVTVTITNPDAELSLGSTSVTFTAPFMGPISVDIDAVDDATEEGPHSGVLQFSLTSSDLNFDGVTVPDLTVDIIDDEGTTPPVVISEIMYNPDGAESDTEWIEIVNTGGAAVDISGWVFDDEDTSDWSPIPAATSLPASGVAIVMNIAAGTDAADAEARFRAEWGVSAGTLVIPVGWGSLANGPSATSEILQLLDGVGGAVIDEVNYDDSGDWPADTGGPSIYLTNLSADNNVGTNWLESDTSASPAQDPVPTSPTGTPAAGTTDTFADTDEGSPGLVAPSSASLTVSAEPAADGYEEGPINGRFLVRLSDVSATDTTMTYTLTGSATSPGDYTAPSGTVTISAGSLTAEIEFTTIDDGVFEGTEDVIITLDAVTAGSATIGTASATVSLFDNDTAPMFNPGDIIINEIMKNPSAVGDTDGEYFEVYNTTGAAIDLAGWVVSDLGSDSHSIASSVVVPAMGYAVLGINSNSATNGGVPVDYQYSGITLGNGTDEIILTIGGTEIDRVVYDDASFPDDAGASLEFLPTLLGSGTEDTDNDTGSNWQSSTTTLGGGPDLGTPGAVNSSPTPEINVTGMTNNIADGDTTPSTFDGTDFGNVVIGVPITNQFTIENNGTADLTVSTISFIGVDAADFSVSGITLPVTLTAGNSTTFDVTFNPTTTGAKIATIEIGNDDADENPYDFDLAGNAATAAVPEIDVESNFISIPDGDTTPSTADNTDFGSVDVSVGVATETYFIQNEGTAPLTITSITFSGAEAGDFTLDAGSITLPVVVPVNGTESFSVLFDPSATGARDATIEIANDDADENPYDFAITGTGVNASSATVLINEVDAQNAGSPDNDEFIELFGPGGTSLDGMVLVLFNGSGNTSYRSIDLDGQSIPADGYFVIGSATVPNVDLVAFTSGDSLQNGADAVALYTGEGSQFPNGTDATSTNIRDAIVYDTNDGDDTGLLTGLGETTQFNEDENGNDDTESNSRVPNGVDGDNFVAQAPTPGAANTTSTGGTIAGRHIFYNNSNYDGNGALVDAADAAAIDTSKAAYLPGTGTAATFANYTSYSRGINGIFVDIAGLGSTVPVAADFEFATGNDNTPSTWAALTTAPTITVLAGAGDSGSDRVALTWPDNTIPTDQWLEINVLSTGPGSIVGVTDTFYFGNSIGEVGVGAIVAGGARIDSADAGEVSANFTGFFDPTEAVTFATDVNKSGRVDSVDAGIVSSSFTGFFDTPIFLINIGVGAGSTASILALPPITGPEVADGSGQWFTDGGFAPDISEASPGSTSAPADGSSQQDAPTSLATERADLNDSSVDAAFEDFDEFEFSFDL